MLKTGIPNLDLILGGGVPEGDVLLVVGPAGSGKTTLALQMAFHVASSGKNAVYISTLSEPPTRLLPHIRPFTFFDERLIGKHLFVLGIYPLIKQGLEKVIDALARAVKEHQATLVIIDGLATIHDLSPQGAEVRLFMYELGTALAVMNVTTLVTSSEVGREGGPVSPELTMSDGILNLGKRDIGTRTIRTIASSKMRGLPNLLGQHSMRIDETGVTVFPRIEAVFKPRDIGLGLERVPTGMPELDVMMHGGPLRGGTTMIAGAAGTGKTLSCLQYVLEGTRRGQKGIFVGFRETPRQLIDKARRFGLDLATPIEDGRLVISPYPSAELVVDEITWKILREVERHAPQRLALDDFHDLEYTLVDVVRRPGYFASLIGLLRDLNVTSIFTKVIPQVVGPELDFSDTPLALIAENLVLLRNVEFRSEVYRVVSVLKMRDSEHDRSIRQYIITDEGFKVLTKLESAEGILTGIARMPSEARVKRTRAAKGEEMS